MSAIQSSVGLITGIPIEDTVDQLIAIAGRPRDLVASRNRELQAERTAIDTLSSLVLSLQFSTNKFNAAATFSSRTAKASNAAVTAAVQAGAAPAVGSYQFTPLQSASTHQFVSASFEDLTSAIGEGTLDFGFGGHVDKGVRLSELNSGAGVAAGKIKITDKNGDSAVIDLRAAQTVDDVIETINATEDISVTASVVGDSFVLTDETGGAGSLSVRDIGSGTTAAGLGLDGLSTTGETITGADVYTLHSGTKLTSLNDGAGVRFNNDLVEVDDLSFTLRDGTTTFGVDLTGATTLGDVIDAINDDEDNAGQITAAISADGRRITITDNTGETAGNLVIANGVLGTAADDLGIAADVAADSVEGGRLVSGLKDALVTQLNGGQGFTLGAVDITDRSGASATVDLSSAETLSDVVDLINAAGIDVTASINSSRSGLSIVDTSGGSGKLTIADAGAETTATDLGIAVDDAVGSINSGSLNRATISEATLLSSLNGGDGIDLGDFRITDSNGASRVVSLDTTGSEAETIGDVIDAINALSIGVEARINDTGDGILLTDTAGGEETLTIAEVNSGTTAADLRLLGASSDTNDDDQQIINGTTRFSVDLSDLEQSTDSLSLSTLNGGSGVDDGIFEIVASDGTSLVIDLGEQGAEAFTVGDVIDKINEAAAEKGVSLSAKINNAGTGIALVDTSGGTGELSVTDLGSGTAAADLKLTNATTGGNNSQTINTGFLFSSDSGEAGALQAVVDRINDLGAGVTASIVEDQAGFRLAITSDSPGAANELLIDASATGFTFQEVSRPKDAVAIYGSSGFGGGFTVTSQSNQFNDVVDGLNLTVNQTTGEPTTIDITQNTQPFTKAVEDFVAAYNSIRQNLNTVTDFDEETLTTGILFGRNETLRVESDLTRVLSGRFLAGEKYGSLEAVGVSLNDDGTLSLDKTQLSAAYADDPTGVERLFTDKDNGVHARISQAVDALAENDNSLLTSRSEALTRNIDNNAERITRFNDQLDRQRDRLLLDFYKLEETISLLQSNLDSIEAITYIQPIRSSNSS